MKIGIIGSGHIGGTLARHFAKAGHALLLASRKPKDLQPFADELGQKTGTASQAAAFGDVVVVATPYKAWPEIGEELGAVLAGKTVIDAANPYPQRDGTMAKAALQAGSGVTTAGFVSGAHVVKAFNTLYWEHLANKGGEGFGMAIGGDDAGALEVVSALVRDSGFEPVVAGGLSEAWRFDPGQPAYAKTLTPDALRAALAQAKPNSGDAS